MYCKKCGNKLEDNDQFCMKCGTRTDAKQGDDITFEEPENNVAKAADVTDTETAFNTKDQNNSEDSYDAPVSTDTIASSNITAQDISLIDKIILKFGDIIMIIVGIVYLMLVSRLFGEGGFWGIAFGILFLIGGISSIVSGAKEFFSRTKKTLSAEDVSKQKKEIGTNILIIIALSIFVAAYSGGSSTVYDNVKKVSFETYGSETIGEIIEDNIKSSEWSSEKIDSSSKKVYVEGYSPLYDEDIQICFYYEESDDTYEVMLQKIVFLDSNETYDSAVDTAIIWATFYE